MKFDSCRQPLHETMNVLFFLCIAKRCNLLLFAACSFASELSCTSASHRFWLSQVVIMGI